MAKRKISDKSSSPEPPPKRPTISDKRPPSTPVRPTTSDKRPPSTPVRPTTSDKRPPSTPVRRTISDKRPPSAPRVPHAAQTQASTRVPRSSASPGLSATPPATPTKRPLTSDKRPPGSAKKLKGIQKQAQATKRTSSSKKQKPPPSRETLFKRWKRKTKPELRNEAAKRRLSPGGRTDYLVNKIMDHDLREAVDDNAMDEPESEQESSPSPKLAVRFSVESPEEHPAPSQTRDSSSPPSSPGVSGSLRQYALKEFNELMKLTIDELRNMCRDQNLAAHGGRFELIGRYMDWINTNPSPMSGPAGRLQLVGAKRNSSSSEGSTSSSGSSLPIYAYGPPDDFSAED